MTAHYTRVKIKSSYEAYVHEAHHVFTPDGKYHFVEKTRAASPTLDPQTKNGHAARDAMLMGGETATAAYRQAGRTADEVKRELQEILSPWEREAILEQEAQQKTALWSKTVGQKLLDKGPLRNTGKKNWDSFEIGFDPSDVDTPTKRQAVFDEVVGWAKTIHTEGYEGAVRAFTIQDWHDVGSRPHLRLELHRIGWEPGNDPNKPDINPPALRELASGEKVLEGTVRCTNYGKAESGETLKDFEPLVDSLLKNHNIHLFQGGHGITQKAPSMPEMDTPEEAAKIYEEASQALEKAQAALGSEPEELTAEQLVEKYKAGELPGLAPPKAGFTQSKPVEDALLRGIKEAERARIEAEERSALFRAAVAALHTMPKLENDKHMLEIERQDLQTRLTRQESALEAQAQVIASSEVIYKELETTAQQHFDSLTETREKLVEVEQERELQTEEVSRLQGEVEALSARPTQEVLAEVVSRAELAEEMVVELEKRPTQAVLDDSEKRLVEALARIAELEKRPTLDAFNEEKRKAEVAVAQTNTLQVQLNSAEQRNQAMAERIGEVNSEKNRLATENATLNQDNQKMMGSSQVTRAQSQLLLTFLEMDVGVLKSKIDELEAEKKRVAKTYAQHHSLARDIESIGTSLKGNFVGLAQKYVELGMPETSKDPALESAQNQYKKANGEHYVNAHRQLSELSKATNAGGTLAGKGSKALGVSKANTQNPAGQQVQPARPSLDIEPDGGLSR